MNRTEGRMIKKSISESRGFSELSPKAAVLFCMIIPHLNSHGKSLGGAGYVKDMICPLIPYLTLKIIPSLLCEISEKTNLKYFDKEGRFYLHAINFLTHHQKLDKERLGRDLLQSYSRVTPELLKNYSITKEVEVEVKDKEKEVSKEPPTVPLTLTQQQIIAFLAAEPFHDCGERFVRRLTQTHAEGRVLVEIKKIPDWLAKNPAREDGMRSWPKFIMNWIKRSDEQNTNKNRLAELYKNYTKVYTKVSEDIKHDN